MTREDPEITERLFNVPDVISNIKDVLMRFGVELGDQQLRRFMPRDKNTVTLFEVREIVMGFVEWMLLVKRNMAERRPPIIVWPHIRDPRVFDQIRLDLLNKFESL